MAGCNRTVLVVGTGTIGEPLIGLLADLKTEMGIQEVIFHKHTPLLEDRSKVLNLERRGAQLAVNSERAKEFEKLGMQPAYEKEEALEKASVVIDCTPKGWGNRNKRDDYQRFEHNALGFIAQGSEFGFGKMYVHGVNDDALIHQQDHYIQVLSCNTHNVAILIHALALSEGTDNLVEGRFLCIRRANDISQDSDYVPSPTISGHKDARFGTHHARDAYHLFRSKGLDLNLFSSAMKVNSQYMHTIYFDLKLKHPTSLKQVEATLREHPEIAVTHKQSANLVFSFGRDHGYFGRILNHTVVVLPSLHVGEGGHRITGFCFTPQDGNSLLSSLTATLWLLNGEHSKGIPNTLKPYIFAEI